MTQNRKRGRNNQEDEVEFMPLSKRINNLHINNRNLLLENGSLQTTALTNIEWGPGPPQCMHSLPETPPNSVQSLDFNILPQYAPDLNETENPHYFNINKLLFEMYVERLQRGCNN